MKSTQTISTTWLEFRNTYTDPVKKEREDLEKYYKEEKERLAILWNLKIKEAAAAWDLKKKLPAEVQDIIEAEFEKFVTELPKK